MSFTWLPKYFIHDSEQRRLIQQLEKKKWLFILSTSVIYFLHGNICLTTLMQASSLREINLSEL